MEKCPYCEQSLGWYYNWPLINVIEFIRNDIPDHMIRHCSAPLDCMGMMSRENIAKIVKGKKEFQLASNVKVEIKKLQGDFCTFDYILFMNPKDVKRISKVISPYFENLEKLVGKTIKPSEFLVPESLENKLKPFGLKLEQYSQENENPKPKYKEISFDVAIKYRDYFNFAAATMKYEGVLLQPNVKP